MQIGSVNFVMAADKLSDAKSQAQPFDHDRPPGTIIRAAYLGRYFRFERIPLRQLLGIDGAYWGWQVESVIADIRNGRGEQLDLLLNDQLIQYQNVYQGEVYFDLGHSYIIDQNIHSLQLGITQDIYIESVRVVLRDPRYRHPGQPPGGGQYDEIRVPVSFARHLHSNDYVDLLQHVDLSTYQGYHIYGLQFYASPTQAHSTIDIYVNGYSAAPRMEISRFNNFYESYFQQITYLDYNTRIELYNSEPLYIENFSVILRR